MKRKTVYEETCKYCVKTVSTDQIENMKDENLVCPQCGEVLITANDIKMMDMFDTGGR